MGPPSGALVGLKELLLHVLAQRERREVSPSPRASGPSLNHPASSSSSGIQELAALLVCGGAVIGGSDDTSRTPGGGLFASSW